MAITVADRRLHIGTDKDAWWRRSYYFAEFHGVRCCGGHRSYNRAVSHGDRLFFSGRWSW